MATTLFDTLPKPLAEAVRERGFCGPTEAQAKAIPPILEGKNVLLISPTASGKTEAAILPVLTRLLSESDRGPGIKILYITPLRALNRDLLDRLQWWASKLDLKVAVRHGDTEIKERTSQSRSPPDMIITTPETLQALLPGRIMRRHLRDIRFVIVDEVHELAEDKRGSQLAIALERLRWVAQREFQVVGLSATIGSPEIVGKFLVGNERSVEILRVPVARRMQIQIISPESRGPDFQLARKLFTHPEVAARLRLMRDMINNHKSVLLFTNTRAVAEVLASRFKVWDIDFPVSIHHGSLAKPARLTAEKGLKEGGLKGLVATSSLELGLDIGRIDYVIQYMSPHQVTRLIQRIGRSGHSVGKMADGVIITMDSDDTLEALVIARKTLNEDLEDVRVPDKPYDVLCHQIAGLLIQNRRWYYNEILEILQRTYSYRNVTEQDVIAVTNYMHSRFPRLGWVSQQDKVVMRPSRVKDLYRYYFNKLSMIPDEKQYLVVEQQTETAVGVLDEAFVAEYGQPGTKFIVRGTAWLMESIRGDKIFVRGIEDPTGAIPSWIGEEIPVPYEIASEVGRIRRLTEDKFRAGKHLEEISNEMAGEFPADETTLSRALAETYEQCEQHLPVPSDKLLTIEEWDDFIIINSHMGTLVNRTLARLIGHILSDEAGISIGIQQDPYRIVLQTMGAVTSEDVRNVLKRLGKMDVGETAIVASKRTGLFKRRLVHVARRFGAISRWTDLSTITLRQLAKTFEQTIIMEEAVRETLERDMDIPHTREVLKAIVEDLIHVKTVKATGEATPIARIGLERISRKTDLIPTEKINRILVGSAKARILNEAKTLVCTSCWKYVEMKRVKDLPATLKCPECGASTVAALAVSDEDIKKVIAKNGARLSEREKDLVSRAEQTAELVEKYGRLAVYTLAGRRVSTEAAGDILRRHNKPTNSFFEAIMQAEREALKERFW
ncbi:MAG TPA: DEAD/DEAH box helicase [Candidatus Bathyarchaeia archaeon]|nr:DEAD/DEAH box helicase [Candidatus Bathyarchaeia archaeon]